MNKYFSCLIAVPYGQVCVHKGGLRRQGVPQHQHRTLRHTGTLYSVQCNQSEHFKRTLFMILQPHV